MLMCIKLPTRIEVDSTNWFKPPKVTKEQLSKGFRQRLYNALLHNRCFDFDEPTTGLDPNQLIEITVIKM
jgi:ABC-type multidrug transport system ATPase subunit